ncbi:ATP-binding protein [Sphingomonas sp. PAMC26645]|uniref:ATP-binding protein n=1 Tax=Sphingomonas sp. PAMC26645 TaxID=2565555 RepID=UPI00109E0470|nr:ATP-binding protein [Sphingomonas sp. PAMC26645]QCB43629.1 ATP-binding protein [Sphingomonas sp. PAMC26645]
MTDDYAGNRYIDALPRPLSLHDWVLALNSLPSRDEDERALPHEDRYLKILRLTRFFRAGARQAEFARGVDAVLREGYFGRDGSNRSHEARQHDVATALEAGDLLSPGSPVVIRKADSSCLIGLPGMGKTLTLDRVLGRYPQVVRHDDGEVQIVWLKLACPPRGSIRALCADFFMEVDGLLGQTTYKTLFGGENASEESMMSHMVVVANRHSIGLLVVDEIQHLGKAGDEEHLLMTFLTTLINKIGVPVLFVGTMSAAERFERTGRMGRRAIGLASAEWPRFERTDGQWRKFVRELWGYQWTGVPTPLDDALIDALHDETQGVVDLVVKLWIAVQVRVIDDNKASGGDEPEIITEKVIREVAAKHLAPMRKLLEALKGGKPGEIAKFEDIVPMQRAFWKSLREADGPLAGIDADADGPGRSGPAHVGQNAAIVRENLEWRKLDEATIADVMRQASEALGPPDNRNMPAYFAKVDDILTGMQAVGTKKRSRPLTPDEVAATYVDGDLRQVAARAHAAGENVPGAISDAGGGIAAAA